MIQCSVVKGCGVGTRIPTISRYLEDSPDVHDVLSPILRELPGQQTNYNIMLLLQVTKGETKMEMTITGIKEGGTRVICVTVWKHF